jgi:hypothetical protein
MDLSRAIRRRGCRCPEVSSGKLKSLLRSDHARLGNCPMADRELPIFVDNAVYNADSSAHGRQNCCAHGAKIPSCEVVGSKYCGCRWPSRDPGSGWIFALQISWLPSHCRRRFLKGNQPHRRRDQGRTPSARGDVQLERHSLRRSRKEPCHCGDRNAIPHLAQR